MAEKHDGYDLFVSYARADDASGWITHFIGELGRAHEQFSGGRKLACFFDREEIRSFDSWQECIHSGLAGSRLMLAFVSPRYFASEWCRREWRGWIDHEIATHILSDGAAPIYIVEVPGLGSAMDEQQVAREVARLCGGSASAPGALDDSARHIAQLRGRQFTKVLPFYEAGLDALQREEVRAVLRRLAAELDERAQRVRDAESSLSTIPPYNKRFSGRLAELTALRRALDDDRAGVISSIHGLGGIGKTELAFTYAHAFASVYPGGRFLVPCEHRPSLRDAILQLGSEFPFRHGITDEERKSSDVYFRAICGGLRARLTTHGRILLVLDNVADLALLSPAQSDPLAALGPHLHLLATTRLAPAGRSAMKRFMDRWLSGPRQPTRIEWLTLGELPSGDALDLLEKHRPFADTDEREAAEHIVQCLGGFALAVELVAAWLEQHPEVSCSDFLTRLRTGELRTLHELPGEGTSELRRHDHEKRLGAILRDVVDELSDIERAALGFAAVLPADHIPLPWLRQHVAKKYPEIATPARPGYPDPWETALRRLLAFCLLTRTLDAAGDPRIVRCHRLVQQYVRSRSDCPRGMAAIIALQETNAFDEAASFEDARWLFPAIDGVLAQPARRGPLQIFRSGATAKMAGIAERGGYLVEAERYWRISVEAAREGASGVFGPFTLGGVLHKFGMFLHRIGKPVEAEKHLREALDILLPLIGTTGMDAIAKACIHNFLLFRGHFDGLVDLTDKISDLRLSDEQQLLIGEWVRDYFGQGG